MRAWRMLALFAVMALPRALPAASPGHVLPDGTYAYVMSVNGSPYVTSTIVVRHGTGKIHIDERAVQNGLTIVTQRVVDPKTFATIGYRTDAGGVTPATIALTATTATVTQGASHLSIDALGAAPFLISDNLIAGFALVPATLHAAGANRLSIACLCMRNFVALAASVVPADEARPAGVPADDASEAISLEGQTLTFWYDRETFVVQAMDLPAQHLALTLRSYAARIARIAPIAPPTPVPLPPAHYTREHVTIVADDGVHLAGTLTMPVRANNRVPGFVLVHGSGCTDRDETIGPNKVFLQIANHLSNEGYAVLRYDKRSCGKSGGTFAVRSRLIADALDVVRFLRRQPGVDPHRIDVLGHSEGGELAPSIAILDGHIRGIVLMAPPARPLAQVSTEQVLRLAPRAQRAAVRQQQRAALARIRAGGSGNMPPAAAAWYRSEMDIDPAKIIATVPCPILILQGTRDIQVLPADLPRLVRAARAAHRNVTVDLLAGDDHLFIHLPGNERSTLSEYFVPSYLDPKLFSSIDAWLRTH